MDESTIWLRQLLKQVKDLKFQTDQSDSEFEQVMLYILSIHLIDWSADTRFIGVKTSGASTSGSVRSSLRVLAEYCKLPSDELNLDIESTGSISDLLEAWVKHRERGECLALFDELFYRIISRAGFNRRHADFVAELTTGLTGEAGIYDVYAYNGEVLIRHFERYAKKGLYEVGDIAAKLQHLTALRFAVHGIEVRSNSTLKANKVKSLTLLDHPMLLGHPFTRLFGISTKGEFVGRSLIVFEVSSGRHDPVQKQIRGLLREKDQLEVVFDFTSYNVLGQARRYNAWLLNSRKKEQAGKTLCIDTRQILESIKGASRRHIAAFASAIFQCWALDSKSLSRQVQMLGPLKGLFAQWFDSGYTDIEGVCKVQVTDETLRAAVSTKRVPVRAIKSEFSLLDRRPLELLLDHSKGHAFCAYVIGNNGAGKSLLLASMISSLKQRNTSCAGITMGPKDRFPGSDKKFGDYRYLGDRTDNGYHIGAVEGRLISLLVEASRDPGRLEKFDHVMKRLGFKHRFYLVRKGALDDVLQPFEITDLLMPLAQQIKELKSTRDLSLAVVREDSTQLYPFSELSSGERQVLVLFTKVLVAAGPGRVLLIDEPEISLHVRWQQLLPQLFGLIAREFDSRLIIATHSPTLVANAQGHSDHCFLAKDQQLTPIEPERRHSVETILLEGFETYTPHNREVRERCAALVSDAIRATNQSKTIDLTQHTLLGEKLDEMRDLMNASGSAHDERFIRDKQLIVQAGRAIDETFKLATRQNDA